MRLLFFSGRWRSSEMRSGGSQVEKKRELSCLQKNGGDEYQPILEKFSEIINFKKGEETSLCRRIQSNLCRQSRR